jgi:Mn2+/Fe2+ NRAMP family transporter
MILSMRRPKQGRVSLFFRRIGPGFITGASDDDPSGILTYAQAGAAFGYGQLWLALWTLPFMVAVQSICGRIGLISGRGIAGALRLRYPRVVVMMAALVLLAANTVNIGADLGAMASSVHLIVPLPFSVLLIGMTALSVLLQVFVPYRRYVRYLRFLALTLLAYVFAAFTVSHSWSTVFIAAALPQVQLEKGVIMSIVAFFGTTISPYLFFWQASEEVEESMLLGRIRAFWSRRRHVRSSDINHMEADTMLGMVFSNSVTFFIILTVAGTLGPAGIRTINDPQSLVLALQPLAGSAATLLFTLGILGTGLLAVPVLAGSAGYALADCFHWKQGLGLPPGKAVAFYSVIAGATIVGALLNMFGIPPFRMLYLSAVLNGLLAPPLMVLILLMGSDARVVGKRVSSLLQNVLGWTVTGVMTVCAGMLLLW